MQSNVCLGAIFGPPAKSNLYKWFREADCKLVKSADNAKLSSRVDIRGGREGASKEILKSP